MARIFKTPFGAQGDTEQVPEAPQGDGSVSLTQGFGYDYEREYEDPAAKDIRREVMNGLFHDVTEAIGDIQLSGIAKWDAVAAPYPAGAMVWHSSAAWMSTAGNNSSEPGTGNWKAVDLSSSIRLSESIEQVPDAETVQEALAALGTFAADGYQNIAVFDTAGVTNWSVPAVLQAGLRKAKVTVVGGGGAGGASDLADTTTGRQGASAGWTVGLLDLTGVETVAVTVGDGGAAQAGDVGLAGESSSFGAYLSASGGEGGGRGSNSNAAIAGVGVGGDLNFPGNNGNASVPGSKEPQPGRAGPFGGAPSGQRHGDSLPSGAGQAPGASGSGGINTATSAGSGFRGIVIVEW